MKGYFIHKLDNGEFVLCKILNQYKKTEEKNAKSDLVDLSIGNLTEEKLLKEFSKKNPLK